MAIYHEEQLLILTKTYPSPSTKYQETSCVAAINHNGEMRRIFPVPFRLLESDQKFSKWQWIKAKITKKNDDHRPESYRIDVDSIKVLDRVSTDHNWAERLTRIDPHIVESFTLLEERRKQTGQTLGFIRPSRYTLEITPADSPDWTPDERQKLTQTDYGLFDAMNARSPIPLRKVPFNFYYVYEIDTPTGTDQHRHKITDWEVGQLYWNCAKTQPDKWEVGFRNRLETDFIQKKSLTFLMGTIHRFPDHWLIVGLVYPPKTEARQPPLFLQGPNA